METNRNYFVAILMSVLVLVGWQFLYVSPKIERERVAAEAVQAQQAAQAPATTTDSGTPGTVSGSAPGGDVAAAVAPAAGLSREQTIAQTARISIDTPSLRGSINLTGARIDDLLLNEYRETIDDSSPNITLFSPAALANGYFAEVGFIADAQSGPAPGPDTVWTAASGQVLTPSSPVTLTYDNGAGLLFTRIISVDEHYLFSFEDTIANSGDATASVAGYGRVTRFFKPKTQGIYVLHEGLIGVIGEEGLQEVDYSDVEDTPIIAHGKATAGWMGITDKYWAAAVVPPQDAGFETRFAHFTDGRARYQSDFKTDAQAIAPGSSVTSKTLVFAGAKEVPVIAGYQEEHNILNFDLMIDWGWFYFLTKPMFWLIDSLFKVFGNFGVAILVTTVIVKLIFFPLANKSYVSMANMKKVQPKLEELKAKHADDKMALQQGMMELYKKEKINPVAGCWPVLLQIPVFFSLYKVLYVTIEMRHAPFFGWIQDLSAPDPTSLFNLFGLLPYDVPSFLMIGVWPLIMGITMFLQMRMNPTPPDPTQAMIFTWMPVVFTFMLATFPAGLVIYWAWNNTLSVTQQGIIMKRQGAKIELWDNLVALFKPKPTKT
ncbi:membrane protein insertase, YidC/Oxa1 family, N-terminal domain [Hoeflea sp. IMCC20628]|uniref:membrane protein insertase YidC n=1 Tax=Hoeflea sp. IMCC20628 TaxID=1620421 RepID=UPI00063ADA2F|nr:membrane protein insertase YidC [Hoeflea sp. IMCC20628]AKI02433.1 membrane protein insertase, YidC/Oxa1 family, N-terminal domain [Hoeflea sp. IMCC20628]